MNIIFLSRKPSNSSNNNRKVVPTTIPKNKNPIIKEDAVSPIPRDIYNKPSLIDSIKSGFGFGIGSSIAHNTINNMFKTFDNSGNDNTKYDDCNKIMENFNRCIRSDNCSKDTIDTFNKLLEKCPSN